MPNKIKSLMRRTHGAAIIPVALALTAFIAVLAIVIDLAHLQAVRQELQNAAEAGALAGTRALFSLSADAANKTYPDCTRGLQTAQDHFKSLSNKSDGTALLEGNFQAQLIRWDWQNNQLNPPNPTCSLDPNTGANGVTVTVRRDSTVPIGAVFLTFGKIFGMDTMDVKVLATAAVGFPGGAPPGTIFPMAITQDMSKNQAPNIDFKIGSAYHYPISEAGQWTSLLQDFNDTSGIRNLMANGNPDPISVGETIHIQPGTKTAIYNSVPMGLFFLPVVSSLVPNSSATVVGFIAFVITDSKGGSQKYIQGHFVTGDILPGSSPGGIYTGTFTQPRLVRLTNYNY